jgi:predicted phage terminase large subunit-like protein
LDHQKPLLLDPARYKVVVCGRRWGKSALALMAALRGHGPSRGFRRGAIDGGKIWWVVPEMPLSGRKTWRDLKRACRRAWTWKSELEHRIELPGGGSISVKSAKDPESLVSEGLDGIVIDEAAKMPAQAWYESLRPTLADTGGWAIFIGTPKGHNWFFSLFQHAGETPDWQRWQRPSSDNPIIPPKELEDARRDAPRYYGQEFEARFTETEGAEWPASYFPDSLWFSDYPTEIIVSALALDPSMGVGERKKGCHAAFVYGGIDKRAVCWVEAWMSQSWDANQLVDKAYEIEALRKPTAVSLETNAGQEFLGKLMLAAAKVKGRSLPLYGVYNVENKEARIRASVGPRLARGELRFRDTPSTRLLVSQLRDFPVGEYVDGPDALEQMQNLLLSIMQGKNGSGTAQAVM